MSHFQPFQLKGVNPDLPRPDPTTMAFPMKAEVGGPFSFSSDPSLRPPTIPTSTRDTFLAVYWNGNPREPRKQKSSQYENKFSPNSCTIIKISKIFGIGSALKISWGERNKFLLFFGCNLFKEKVNYSKT
uniref:Uncharacterized protein n=1 Tax=Nelumbo nucifera TaxID=4432 RepID=A0A822XNI5_NELNU|nr:TPA_asm: hypothetical protein HUJ06_023065 [Nelumbo nucifera]